MNADISAVKPCPDGNAEHGLVEVDEATTGQLNLPRGSLLHLNRRRVPRDGDVVLAELDVQDRRTRTVRRFTLAENVVSLARIDGRPGSLVRPRCEVGILGVVDGHVVPLDRS
jgi:hypothetical protein